MMDESAYKRALQWAMALGAPLLESNDAEPPYAFEDCDFGVGGMLEEQWGVTEAYDVRNLAERMWAGMHNPSFQEIRLLLGGMTLAERRAYIGRIDRNTDRYADFYTVNLYMDRLPPAGIAAWDWGRLAFYVRCARMTGLIGEAEENAYLLNTALRARFAYRSWPDYAVAYMAGRQFWRRDISEEWSEINLGQLRSLLIGRRSLWRELEWEIDLPEPPNLPEYGRDER
ncbi:DUF1266 domain-containing protein [Saccharibacillus sp. CPCC 101409]|uniref:DUF1266 domain-containing protein n=1 Tax=Saccharibacillus sp. CPCC 101409 TaxID=3058041 RepID=UPI0026729CD5|nr:DUF1266 domain-containing protein [Saccharibacillus sp. CPCC 101409]MDO3411986.1 DUF1266 domain-containing protein [Saccharibacillus sp. CPCC 101409]